MLNTTSIGTTLKTYIQLLSENGIQLSETKFLAGGCIRRAICGQKIEEGDLDVYSTQNAPELRKITVEHKINNILVQQHAGYGDTIEKVLKWFDFTCCQFACDGSKIYYVGNALDDAKQGKLIYTGNAGQWTLSRVFRLQGMGFKPDKTTLKEMEKLSCETLILAGNRAKKTGRSGAI